VALAIAASHPEIKVGARSPGRKPEVLPARLRGQAIAALAVEDHHVKRGRRGALLVEAPDVEAVDVHVRPWAISWMAL
jgi:hypothetical protein